MQVIRPLPIRLATLAALVILPLALPSRTAAQETDTSWTSVEGTTIWARLEGWNGSQIKLVRRGRTYWVPLERLSPASIEKARKLLGESSLASHSTRSQAVPRQPSRRPARPAATALRRSSDPLPPPAPAVEQLPELPTENLPTEPPADDNLAAVLPDPAPEVSAIPLPPEPSAPGPADIARLDYRRLVAPAAAPAAVRAAVAAGNRLQNKPYKWGGGRARLEDTGYDCSGSVSYILIHAGLLRSTLNSSGFTRYGAPGPGRWITIYARHGHVFMTICGIRLDTGGHAEKGPRWCASYRNARGFVMRHPPGL